MKLHFNLKSGSFGGYKLTQCAYRTDAGYWCHLNMFDDKNKIRPSIRKQKERK